MKQEIVSTLSRTGWAGVRVCWTDSNGASLTKDLEVPKDATPQEIEDIIKANKPSKNDLVAPEELSKRYTQEEWLAEQQNEVEVDEVEVPVDNPVGDSI